MHSFATADTAIMLELLLLLCIPFLRLVTIRSPKAIQLNQCVWEGTPPLELSLLYAWPTLM